ncbi:SMP-30/gluconolactonase/LRE family protein [Streptomyces sp. F001]|uniref:SMP-30/gluconolactonase/LRE family protein n=1 Tax=Streptomyces sp. F001 TaxID=1510026 RepID=UPI00101E589E|nr:SMP-30/gluconolactonase/LRE family protein [Streptomyces sp. F001]RZB19292.1 SMP-30/gluconolactonase/LRE family protein [Streptomyces sp. F001]
MTEAEAEALRPDRLELGEGIRWTDRGIVLVDILAGRLLTAVGDPAAPLQQLAQLPVPLGAVAPVVGAPGTWIAAAGTGICLLTPDGAPRWLAQPEADAARPMRMNDATADPSGRFWAGSMSYDAHEGAGSLYRIDHDGTVARLLDGITVPNGPAFTDDGATMYLADSARGIIRRYPVDPVTADLGAPEAFVTVADGSPDGMVVDVEGAVWVAVWGTGTVRRYLPDGHLDRTLHLPARQPAGVCLQEDRLHITTARVGLAAPGPHDGAIFTARVDVPGRPTASYRHRTSASSPWEVS